MLSINVLSAKEKRLMYDRIRAKMGLMSQVELAKRMTKAGCPTTSKTISAWSSGRSAPSTESWIALMKVLGLSVDWAMTGKHIENPNLADFRKMIDTVVVSKGYALRDLDPDLKKVIDILIALPETDRAPLASMVEAYVQARAKK